jgi:hypothetical protein
MVKLTDNHLLNISIKMRRKRDKKEPLQICNTGLSLLFTFNYKLKNRSLWSFCHIPLHMSLVCLAVNYEKFENINIKNIKLMKHIHVFLLIRCDMFISRSTHITKALFSDFWDSWQLNKYKDIIKRQIIFVYRYVYTRKFVILL